MKFTGNKFSGGRVPIPITSAGKVPYIVSKNKEKNDKVSTGQNLLVGPELKNDLSGRDRTKKRENFGLNLRSLILTISVNIILMVFLDFFVVSFESYPKTCIYV